VIFAVRHAYAGQMCACSEGDRQTPPHSSIPGQSVTEIYAVVSRSEAAEHRHYYINAQSMARVKSSLR